MATPGTGNISIVKEPETIVLSENDIVYRFSTTNKYSQAGSKASLKIIFSDSPASDDTMTIEWLTKSVNFTFKNDPDNSGYQLPTNAGYNYWDDYFEDLVQYLKDNYHISNNFNVSYSLSDDSITFTADERGSEYTITFTTSSGNITEDTNTAGTDVIERPNYRLMVRLYYSGDFGYVQFKSEDRIPFVGDSDEATINLKDYIKTLTKPRFNFPGETGVVVRGIGRAVTPFYIEYAESYDNDVYRLVQTDGNKKYALNGGLDTQTIGKNNDEGLSLIDWLDYRSDFLTYQPREKYVLRNQPERLYFLVYDSDITEIKLRVEGGASASFYSKSVSTYTVYEFDVTPFRLVDDDVNEFNVTLFDQDGRQLTVSRTFHVREESRYERVFIFRNSLSGYDTIRLTGKGQNDNEYEKSQKDYFRRDENISVKQFQKFHDKITEQQKINVSTGYFAKVSPQPKLFANFLREFALSKEIYEVISGQLYPSLVVSDSVKTLDDSEELLKAEFEMIRAYTDEHFVHDSNLVPDRFFTSEFDYRFVK